MEDIVLVGFGGHAKSIIDSIEAAGQYRIAGFTEVDCCNSYRGYNYLGDDSKLQYLFDSGIKNACISIGYLGTGYLRDELYNILKDIGYSLPSIIDPTAVIAKDAIIAEGAFIGKRAVVNSAAVVGEMSIINTGAIIEHESIVGPFTHVSVNSVLCGQVVVHDHCFIGAGTTVIQGLTIGKKSIVGAGSLILDDVGESQKVYNIFKKHG